MDDKSFEDPITMPNEITESFDIPVHSSRDKVRETKTIKGGGVVSNTSYTFPS